MSHDKHYIYKPLPNSKDIRLISFEDSRLSENGDGVRFSFVTTELDRSPSYHALSYTWGDPRPNVSGTDNLGTQTPSKTQNEKLSVLCEGLPIAVTENLLLALSHISKTPQLWPHLWWIDAICINQADSEERSAQVAMMGSIYSTATKVVVWLGPNDQDADAYAHLEATLIGRLLEIRDREGFESVVKYHPDDDQLWDKLNLHKQDYPQPLWDKVNSFWSRAWFSRGWIVQEVSLAKAITVYCGDRELLWDFLIGFADIVSTGHWFQQIDVGLSVRGQEQWGSPGNKLWFLLSLRNEASKEPNDDTENSDLSYEGNLAAHFRRIIRKGRWFATGDPRDKIYAFLGLVTNHDLTDAALLRPNYAKSSEAVYIDAATYILENTSSLRLLAACEGGQFRHGSNVHKLPSWVPDFSNLQVSDGLNFEAYNAAKGLGNQDFQKPFQIVDTLLLSVEGIYVDTIGELGGNLQYLKYSSDFAKDWEMFLRLDQTYWNGQVRTEVIWRTLIADYAYKSSPVDTSFSSQFRSFVLFLGSIIYDPNVPTSHTPSNEYTENHKSSPWTNYNILQQTDQTNLLPSLSEITQVKQSLSSHFQEWSRDIRPAEKSRSTVGEMQTYHERIVPAITGRKLFRSAGRHNLLGLCPFYSEPGDMLWILKGSRVPFVLRPRRETLHGEYGVGGRGGYELIGECYVHGLMHGEIKDFCGERKVDLERILLR